MKRSESFLSFVSDVDTLSLPTSLSCCSVSSDVSYNEQSDKKAFLERDIDEPVNLRDLLILRRRSLSRTSSIDSKEVTPRLHRVDSRNRTRVRNAEPNRPRTPSPSKHLERLKQSEQWITTMTRREDKGWE